MRRTDFLLALAVAAACHSYAFAQAQGEAEYGLKEDRLPTGTNIRRYFVTPIRIPINRSYAELSPEDRQKWHQNYEDIKEGDEPPFPVGGLKSIFEPMAKVEQKLMVSGDLLLVATIDPKGEVEKVEAVGSPSPEMARIAAQILLLTKFKPAVCSGHPCRMDFPLRLKFARR